MAYAKVLEELLAEISPSGAYWNPNRIISDNRLAAFATDLTQYRFMVPDQVAVKIDVKLLYRRVFKMLMDQKGWIIPNII